MSRLNQQTPMQELGPTELSYINNSHGHCPRCCNGLLSLARLVNGTSRAVCPTCNHVFMLGMTAAGVASGVELPIFDQEVPEGGQAVPEIVSELIFAEHSQMPEMRGHDYSTTGLRPRTNALDNPHWDTPALQTAIQRPRALHELIVGKILPESDQEPIKCPGCGEEKVEIVETARDIISRDMSVSLTCKHCSRMYTARIDNDRRITSARSMRGITAAAQPQDNTPARGIVQYGAMFPYPVTTGLGEVHFCPSCNRLTLQQRDRYDAANASQFLMKCAYQRCGKEYTVITINNLVNECRYPTESELEFVQRRRNAPPPPSPFVEAAPTAIVEPTQISPGGRARRRVELD